MTALRLKVSRDFKEGDNNRIAGDEFLFEGPGTYLPRKEVEVVSVVRAEVIRWTVLFNRFFFTDVTIIS
jgi:major vault protein